MWRRLQGARGHGSWHPARAGLGFIREWNERHAQAVVEERERNVATVQCVQM